MTLPALTLPSGEEPRRGVLPLPGTPGLPAAATHVPNANDPRSIRNANQGNIMASAWTRQQPGYLGEENGYAIFDNPDAGVNAQQQLLRSYANRGYDTVNKIVNRWAPAAGKGNSAESTRNYANYVAQRIGVGPEQKLDLSNPDTLSRLADAMGEFESGKKNPRFGMRSAAGVLPVATQEGAEQAPAILGEDGVLPIGQPGTRYGLRKTRVEAPAEFANSYENLFGTRPSYERPELVALSGQEPTQAPWQLPPLGGPAAGGETEWADYAKNFMASVGGLGAGIGGIGEYAMNRMEAAGVPSAQGGEAAAKFGAFRQGAQEFQQNWFNRMTPEAQARAEREFLNLDPNKTMWQGGAREFLSSIGLKMAGSGASTAVSFLPGGLLLRAGLAPGAIAYLGASEGFLSMGDIHNNIQQEIAQAPESELMQSPLYAQLRAQGVDDEEARRQLSVKAEGYTPLIGGLIVGAISAAAGKYLEPVFVDKAAGVWARAMRGGVSEAGQEAGQSAAEQTAQNVAAQVFDQSRGMFQGVGEAAIQGAAVGGPMGAGISAMLGPRPEAAPPPPPARPTGLQTMDQVFRQQMPPRRGAWMGGDIEFPDYDASAGVTMTWHDPDEGLQQRQFATEEEARRFGYEEKLVNPVITPDVRASRIPEGIDPAIAAAIRANAQADMFAPSQGDMFTRGGAPAGPTTAGPVTGIPPAPVDAMGMTPQQRAEQAAYTQRPWPSQQSEMDVTATQPGPAGPGVMVPGTSAPTEQMPLGMRARERGRPVIEPTPNIAPREDMTAPPEVSLEREAPASVPGRRPTIADFEEQARAQRYRGTVRSPDQADLFADPESPADSNLIAGMKEAIQDAYETTGDSRIGALQKRFAPRTTLTRGQVAQVYQTLSAITGVDQTPGGLQRAPGTVRMTKQYRDVGTKPGFAVTMRDDAGNVIHQARYRKLNKAQGAAHKLRQKFPDANITMGPARERVAAHTAQVVPDAPSAEPIADLIAQLKAMRSGPTWMGKAEGGRQAVYVSKDNLANLRRNRQQLPDVGVPLANFDGKGGLLIARNGEIAKRLLAERDAGADLQEVIGRATQSGTGKPAGANIVVQQRDAQGNVLRESLVSTQEEAEALAEEFDSGGQGFILTAGAAIKRRAQRIEHERQVAEKTQTEKKDIRRRERAEELKGRPPIERYKAAREELAQAEKDETAAKDRGAKIRARERQKQAHATMQELYPQVRQELMLTAPELYAEGPEAKPSFFTSLRERIESIVGGSAQQLGKLAELPERVRKQLKKLSDKELAAAFEEAIEASDVKERRARDVARISGQEQERGETYEAGAKEAFQALPTAAAEIRAKHEQPSKMRKFIVRQVYSLIKRAVKGRGKGTGSTPITAKTKRTQAVKEVKNRVITRTEVTREKGGVFNPSAAFDLLPPRELSTEERQAHAERVQNTYDTLDTHLKTFKETGAAIETELTGKAQEREDDGNPPHMARNALYGRQYLRSLQNYGRMLKKLRPRSKTGLKEVEHYNKIMSELLPLRGEELINKLADLMKAESKYQARSASKAAPLIKTAIGEGYSSQRRKAAEAVKDKLDAKVARAKELHDMFHANAAYEQHIAPLIQKLIGYVTRDPSLLGKYGGKVKGLGYVPTFSEMKAVRNTLREFNKSDEFKERKQGQLLTKWFKDFGFKFDSNNDLILAKNAAEYQYENERQRLQRLRNKAAFRNAPENYNQIMKRRRAEWAEKRREAVRKRERERRAKLSPELRAVEDQQLLERLEKQMREYEKGLAAQRDDDTTLHAGRHISEYSMDRSVFWSEPVFDAAHTLAEHLEQEKEGFQTYSLHDALETIRAKLPHNHDLTAIVDRLLALKMHGVPISWGKSRGYGQYRQVTKNGRTLRHITLNRELLEDLRAKGTDPAPTMVYALLHEGVHAATIGEIRTHPRAKHAMRWIMAMTKVSAEAQGISLKDKEGNWLYGFDPEHEQRGVEVDEFLAEAFTNPGFQAVLRRIQVAPQQSAWDRIIKFVCDLLGVPNTVEARNALDVILATGHHLMTGAIDEKASTQGAKAALNVSDTAARQATGNVLDKAMQSSRLYRQFRERAVNTLKENKAAGPPSFLSGHTMEQLKDRFADSFGGRRGSMNRFMDAFFRREADHSKNLDEGNKVLQGWTDATEKTGGEHSIELSRVMTEATLYGMHPDKPLSHADNEHITSPQMKAKHEELARRYHTMEPAMRQQYQKLRDYYARTLRTEINLAAMNAINAVTGGNVSEADVERLKLYTKEGLESTFADQITERQRRAITHMAQLPAMHTGPYFPLMRHGDYIVTAKREKESRTFNDIKSARAWAREQRASDPTLSVSHAEDMGDGQFRVTVTEKEVRMAETYSEAEAARQEMVAHYGEQYVSPQVMKRSELDREQQAAITSGSGLNAILNKLKDNPAAQNAIKDYYLRSLSNASFRKREIKRANRKGVDYDTQMRSLANYIKSASYYIAQLRFGSQMASGLADMNRFAREVGEGKEQSDLSSIRLNAVVNEIRARDKIGNSREEPHKLIRAGTALSQFLMLSTPSYWFVNASQPYMVTLPWLAARSSAGDATSALLKAQKMIADPIVNQMLASGAGVKALWSKASANKAFSVLDQVREHIEKRGGARSADYLKMLEALRQRNILDLTMQSELRDIAEGQPGGAVSRVMDASRIMSHLTEVNNRIITALAAYDVYRNKGMSHEAAQGFAQDAVSMTQFNYSSGNSPRLFSDRGPLGPMGPLVFQFMKYPQHIYALMIKSLHQATQGDPDQRRMGRNTLLGLLATHVTAGGLVGAMIQPAKWAIGLAMALFSDDEGEDRRLEHTWHELPSILSGRKYDRAIRGVTNDLFGFEAGNVLSGGVGRLVGLEMSQRMALGSLYFIDIDPHSTDTLYGSIMGSFGGPALSLPGKASDAIRYMSDGQVLKGLEQVMPKFGKDILRTIRYSSEGLTDGQGKPVVGAEQMSAGELFAQAMGFQPASISDKYAQRAAVFEAKGYAKDQRNDLINRFNRAAPGEAQDVLSDIVEFNARHPAASITRAQLLKAKHRYLEGALRTRRFGVDLLPRDREYLEAGSMYEEEE